MSLREQQAVVLRLVTNAPYRERFFAAPPDAHAEFGLDEEEYRVLRRLDARRLEVAGGGNVHKRFDGIAPAFPVSLRFLEPRVPDLRERYAARFLLPSDPAREWDQFRAFALALPLPASERPFLAALVDLERRVRDLAPVAPAPWRLSDDLRPRAAPGVLAWKGEVDLAAALDAYRRDEPMAAPPPGTSSRLLAWNEAGKMRWEPLDEAGALLLAAADGTRTLRDLREAHGDDSDAALVRWLRAGVAVPAP